MRSLTDTPGICMAAQQNSNRSNCQENPCPFFQENPDLTDVLCVMSWRTTGLDFSESKESKIPEPYISL